MALETGTYISDLNVTNPAATDGIGQADDHIRLIKSTLKSTFPSITGAVSASNTELNKLTGATLSTDELNTLDGILATTTELNKLSGYTGTSDDLNKIASVTASAAELSKLSGVTATTAELNKLSGLTTSTTELNRLAGYTGNVSDLNIIAGAAAAGVTQSEFNALNGVTSSIQTQLDARLLKTGGTVTGNVTLNDNVVMNFGSGSDTEMFHNGTNMYMDVNNGGIFYIRDGNSSNATRYTFDVDTGNFTASGNITAYSDARLKSDIRTIPDALEMVKEMRGVFYTKDQKPEVGVIAQEMQVTLPEVVHQNENGLLSVAYGNIVAVLIEAVKQLEKKVADLEAQKGD